MRRIIVCALFIWTGCAERNFVNRGDGTGVPASSVTKKVMPGESLEDVRPKLKTNLDPDRAPDATNYD